MFSVLLVNIYFTARSLKTLSDYQYIMGVWRVVVMMDIDIICKGHCETSPHFLDHVTRIVYVCVLLALNNTVYFLTQRG